MIGVTVNEIYMCPNTFWGKKSYYERWSTNSHGSHAAANAIAASPLLFL
jgi:hypothetical protein